MQADSSFYEFRLNELDGGGLKEKSQYNVSYHHEAQQQAHLCLELQAGDEVPNAHSDDHRRGR
jgi:hypothetical protein